MQDNSVPHYKFWSISKKMIEWFFFSKREKPSNVPFECIVKNKNSESGKNGFTLLSAEDSLGHFYAELR